ncbi:MAG TPA: DUF5597 domain-containing protein [Chryseolinea sp.]|nr:DUF5597 domain-containing protein [Chryseolinea sp.]
MKRYFNYSIGLILLLAAFNVNSQIPRLEKKANTSKLIVDGKPFIILGGELHNSTGSDKEAIGQVCKELKDMGLNTILGYAYWEFIEPVEGTYNFELVDELVQRASENQLKIVLVWFGSWKSTASTYTPAWVKTNPKRFPRHTLTDGKTLEILSPFSEENMKADAKAYEALMRHIKETDKKNTVIMTQVENEPGCFDGYRDMSKSALKAWQSPMPTEMVEYLKANKGKLFPALEKNWGANGYKTKGTWEDILGKSTEAGEYKFYTEELFMAYHYSKYMNYIAELGRKQLDLPAFCNAWKYNKLGFYPHGTCNPHVLDAYRAGGNFIDFYAPNVYTLDYDDLFKGFTMGGNTLFIPESGLIPAGALYSIAEFNSIGFSPFGIDGESVKSPEKATDLKILKEVYSTVSNTMDLLSSFYNTGKMRGVYVNPKKIEHIIELGDYIITAKQIGPPAFSIDFGKSLEYVGKNRISFAELSGEAPAALPTGNSSPVPNSGPPPAAANNKPKIGSAMIIQPEADVFLVIGYGLQLHFEIRKGIDFQHLGFISIDEGAFVNNQFVPKKRWNGDEQKTQLPEGKLTCLKIKLYRN